MRKAGFKKVVALMGIGGVLFILLGFTCCASAVADGNSVTTGLIVVPFPIYSPETKTAITLTGLYHYGDPTGPAAARPSMIVLSLAYSELDQARIGLNPELYLKGGKWLLEGELAYEDWPDKFWGVGSDSSEADEEKFGSRNRIGRTSLKRRFGSMWWLGLLYDHSGYNMTQLETGGQLETGTVPGSDGGEVSGIGAVVMRDTRDDIYCPRSGSLMEVSASRFDDVLGSDFDFHRYMFDARRFIETGGGKVLALQVYSHITEGEVPFQYMPRIGCAGDSSLMRGYQDGRFRDTVSVLGQAEYRFPVWGRWSGAVFGGVGEVGPELDALTMSDLKWAGGAGLRFQVSKQEAVKLRLDIGLSEEGANVYFNLFEAF